MFARVLLLSSVAMLAVAGCTDRPTGSDGDDTAGSTTTGTPPSATSPNGTAPPMVTTSGPSTTSTDGGLDTGGSSSGVSSIGFICSEDDQHWHCDGGGVDFECSTFAQDCPVGHKCIAWSNDGGPVWNATRCTPMPRDPGESGEPCTVEGNAVSGIDSCVLDSMCWNVDPLTNEGECVAMCIGDESDPMCDEGSQCTLTNDGAIALCLPTCNPLASTCEADHLCLPRFAGEWVCVPAVPMPFAVGEPCELANVCAPGSVCTVPDASPACAGEFGCCTPTCDLAVGECPDAATECVPWYGPGEDPPGFEGTGLCSVLPAVPRGGWTSDINRRLVSDQGR